MTQAAVNAGMVKVMDWQLAASETKFNRLWTFAALYDGLLAASAVTHHPEGHDAVLRAAERWHWQLEDTRFPHADDEALGQAYLTLYAEHPKPARLGSIMTIMDRLAALEDTPDKPVWWWCDALFMAPPVLVRVSLAIRVPGVFRLRSTKRLDAGLPTNQHGASPPLPDLEAHFCGVHRPHPLQERIGIKAFHFRLPVCLQCGEESFVV